MAREIKFRAIVIDDDGKERLEYNVWPTGPSPGMRHLRGLVDNGGFWMDCKRFEQYTGLKDKNGKEIYEGDIFRVEEDGVDDNENGDKIYYLVIVWINEWTMFGTLNITNGEYQKYLMQGSEALDEPLFWTYTLEDTNDRRFYLCGNIYENAELLK